MADIPARVAPRVKVEQDLAGKVGCVTGASKGIGRAIALGLASRGCSILATSSRPETQGDIDLLREEIKRLYREHGSLNPPDVIGIVANVTSSDFANVIADAIAKHFESKIDIYVNNAAVLDSTDVGDIKVEDIQRHLVGGVQTPILTVEELVRRRMFQKESRIVHISSVASRTNPAFQYVVPADHTYEVEAPILIRCRSLLYNVSKSAGESLVRTWANIYGGRHEKFAFMAGTTANSVNVGLTETSATTQFGPEMFEQWQKEFTRDQALPRVSQPEDIADVVGMLCSKDSRWVTGSVVSADGGGVFIK